MFCSKCGKAIEDGASFCGGCGAPVGAAQSTTIASAPVSAPNPIFSDFVKRIKGFFSLNAVKTVGEAAKSSGLEWLLLAGIAILSYTLALASNLGQFINSVVGGFVGGYLYNFGIGLVYGLLLGAGTYFLMSVLIFLTMKVIYKKDVGIFNVFNMVAVACMPLSCVYILNIVFGFIWTPLVLIFSAIGMVATVVLLYAGMQKLAKFESSPFLAYICIWAIVIAIVGIIIGVAVSLAVGNLVGNTLGNAVGYASSLASLY